MADAEIRFVGDMQRLQVRPGDIFVLQIDYHIPHETAERLREIAREAIGGDAKVLVLSGGAKLGVMGSEG